MENNVIPNQPSELPPESRLMSSEITPEERARLADAQEGWPTPQECELLFLSFVRLMPKSDVAAASFYESLFAKHPEVRPLFPTSTREQEEKFMMMIAWIVEHLRNPDEMAKTCIELGERHRALGTKPAHYGPVGEILVETLKAYSEPPLSEAEIAAWGKLYGVLVRLMA